MASVSRGMGVPSDQPQGAYYTVTITQTIYSSATGGNLGGGVSPKTARDHGTAPTTLVISRMLNRGNIRYKKMLEFLQTRTNVKIVNLLTGGDSNGDTQLTSLAFGIVFENDDYVPTTGTSADGSTTFSTKVAWIQDKIAEALTGTFTENCTVFDPSGSNAAQIKTESLTAGPVSTAHGEVVESVAVAEVAAFRSNVDAETPDEGAGLASTAE
jgi:hypothetical protein|tara:strand:+ start:3306 stop:3944 length:639 start_codon:yes stop_codon:yes gene_type:complete